MGLFYVLAIKYAFKNSRQIGVGSVHVDRVGGKLVALFHCQAVERQLGIYKSINQPKTASILSKNKVTSTPISKCWLIIHFWILNDILAYKYKCKKCKCCDWMMMMLKMMALTLPTLMTITRLLCTFGWRPAVDLQNLLRQDHHHHHHHCHHHHGDRPTEPPQVGTNIFNCLVMSSYHIIVIHFVMVLKL